MSFLRGGPRLVLLVLAIGAGGAALLTGDLVRAMRESRSLYATDTLGSQIESEIKFQAQECRRSFLYALSTTDPNEQLPYVDESRLADERMQAALRRLMQLTNDDFLRRPAQRLTKAWQEYQGVRDLIIASILEGDIAGAVAADNRSGKPAFQAVLRELDHTKSGLERHAREQSRSVDRTLMRCSAELLAFLAIIGCVLAALVRSNTQRNVALAGMQTSNVELSAARRHQQRRAEVLEMVTRRDDLSSVLYSVARLVPDASFLAGAAIWVAVPDGLELRAAVNCPGQLEEEIGKVSGPAGLDASGPPPELIRDANTQVVGALKVFPPPNGKVSETVIGEVVQLASVAIESRLMHEQLTFRAQHDPLTGVPNQTLFHDRLEQAILRARRTACPAALLWVDMDRFKTINDTLGHRAGDELLIAVARRLRKVVRASDTVARVGGDEFAVVVNGVASLADATEIAHKLLAAVCVPVNLVGHEVTVTASCGVSVYPEHGADMMSLTRNADLAMYHAKRAGRNGVHVYRPEYGADHDRRLEIERQLENAVARNEFRLDYQAAADSNGAIRTVDASPRWERGGKETYAAAEFLLVAEECGMVSELGEWMLRTACADGAGWLRAERTVERISVNVSPRLLARHDFAARLEEVLNASGLPADKLEIEVPESAFLKNVDPLVQQMETLRRAGVSFSIGKFGAGYSPLDLLRSLPVSRVKMDRSLVEALDGPDASAASLAAGIVALAHGMGLEVVAGGVESENQKMLLLAMGCDLLQGGLLLRPRPAGAMETLLPLGGSVVRALVRLQTSGGRPEPQMA